MAIHKTTVIIAIFLILVMGVVIPKFLMYDPLKEYGKDAGVFAAGSCQGYGLNFHPYNVYEEASIHFDHPLQRLLTIRFGTRDYDSNTHTLRIVGYSLFGLEITEAIYNCKGGLTTVKSFFFF